MQKGRSVAHLLYQRVFKFHCSLFVVKKSYPEFQLPLDIFLGSEFLSMMISEVKFELHRADRKEMANE